jgi:hypothetical protein
MALGDSLAFGFQQDKFTNEILNGTYDPASFNTGFVDVLSSILRGQLPNLKMVNFSCPGETIFTFALGGCPIHYSLFALPLHDDYPAATTQLQAAVNYLQAHPNEVVLITLTIGNSDLLQVIGNCNRDAACVEQAMPALYTNAGDALQKEMVILKTVAPNTPILYTNVPNPYRFTNPDLEFAFQWFNGTMYSKVSQIDERIVFWAEIERNLDSTTFCQVSAVCNGPTFDVHPTDLGYRFLGWQTALALQPQFN